MGAEGGGVGYLVEVVGGVLLEGYLLLLVGVGLLGVMDFSLGLLTTTVPRSSLD